MSFIDKASFESLLISWRGRHSETFRYDMKMPKNNEKKIRRHQQTENDQLVPAISLFFSPFSFLESRIQLFN